MARLINPGTGEYLDRLSILSLKILHGRLAGKPVDHFENERNAILTKVRAGNSFERWLEEYVALGAVNAALWHAEDELRDCRRVAALHPQTLEEAKGLQAVVECAFRIQDLNDQRNQLIAAINQKTGEHLGLEKLNG